MKKILLFVCFLSFGYSVNAQIKSRTVGTFMTGNSSEIVEFSGEDIWYVFYFQNFKYQSITDTKSALIGNQDDLKKFIYDCDSIISTIKLGKRESIYDVEVGVIRCAIVTFGGKTSIRVDSDDNLGYTLITKPVIKRFKKSLVKNGLIIDEYGK
jgi:hypothetical protein